VRALGTATGVSPPYSGVATFDLLISYRFSSYPVCRCVFEVLHVYPFEYLDRVSGAITRNR
jgi:hypothetical protein